MFVRIPSASLSCWGRLSLVLALGAVPLFANCSKSEDTEPFVPSVEGAKQPAGDGDLVSEADACERLLEAATGAYDRLRCGEPDYPQCPGFLRPGGGSGCYEYREGSVAECEQSYEDAKTCRALSPCLATAVLNTELPTCETLDDGSGAGGAGGSDAGGAGAGGAPIVEGGGPGVAGQPAQGGAGGDASGGATP